MRPLLTAGDLSRIPHKDQAGRYVDFHSLRVSLSTMLAAHKVSPRAAQALMRPSDPRLTAGVHTGEVSLSTEREGVIVRTRPGGAFAQRATGPARPHCVDSPLAGTGTKPGLASRHAFGIRKRRDSGRTYTPSRTSPVHAGRDHHPKTDVVVPVVGRVPVAVRRAAVLRFVVPRAAAKHTAGHSASSL